MKAWYLENSEDPDQGTFVVFANTRNEARAQADSEDLMYDRWIDLRATRAKRYDGLERMPARELALKQWHEGWRWFDHYNMPDVDEDTDEAFLAWYDNAFGVVNV